MKIIEITNESISEEVIGIEMLKLVRSIFISPGRLPNGMLNFPNINIMTPTIKIVIPKNSGLTYSEAWTFMKGLLEKYDYYYQ